MYEWISSVKVQHVNVFASIYTFFSVIVTLSKPQQQWLYIIVITNLSMTAVKLPIQYYLH